MSTERTCSRCGDSIARPVAEHANYVVSASDFVEAEPQEVHYAMRHTDKTTARLDALVEAVPNKSREMLGAEMADERAPDIIEVPDGTKRVENDDGSWTETAARREVQFSVPNSEFEHVEVDDPHIVSQREDVARVYTQVEERDVQKTGLVCPDCVKDSDEIAWGVNA